MKIIAFVPARCGSKSIPFKNIRNFCGKPLIYWVLKSLEESRLVNEVYVATDCDEIEAVVKSFNLGKVNVYKRTKESASDIASTEMVMIEFLSKYNFTDKDLFILAQATSPFTQSNDFDNAIEKLLKEGKDSLLSCVRIKKFLWNEDGTPINYDYKDRPRRQDFKGTLVENGAFYINRVGNIFKYKNRLSGRIAIYEMPEFTYTELDEEDDWIIAERLFYKYVLSKNLRKRIKIFLCDVDGTLTDGGIYYSKSGEELKKFNTIDGKGFELLKKAGIKIGIITSENSKIVEKRAKKLNVDYIYQGVQGEDKLKVALKICEKENASLNEVAYIGDDIGCKELLKSVGFAACPSNAVEEIKNIPGIIQLSRKGGEGAVREFIEIILKALDK